jgi:hypothetical protein
VNLETAVYNDMGTLVNHQNKTKQGLCTFDSRRPGSSNWGSGGQREEVRCVSKGLLEQEILAMVK